MDLFSQIPAPWQVVLRAERGKGYLTSLAEFLANERAEQIVHPPVESTFRALQLTPPSAVRAVIVGQDPYHGPRQAHGLAFSVPPGIKPPPSLVNMFKELASDLGIQRPQQGMLEPWAQQGVLLLNTCLTVRAGAAGSHRGQGWETLTDAILQAVQSQEELTVFVFWGADAQKKKKLIDSSRHPIIESAHPSPLSARTGFFGSRPFSRINAALKAAGRKEIDWQLNTEHHLAMPPAAVLLIAHGSRRAEANQDLQNLSARVAQKLPHLIVETAYLELTQPTIPEGAAACVSRGATRVMMTPYFLSAGNHVREDLEGFRQDFTAQYPGVTFQLGEPLGTHPLMTEIVLDQIRSFPE